MAPLWRLVGVAVRRLADRADDVRHHAGVTLRISRADFADPALAAFLQAHLDDYQHFYNHHRPHSALDGATPFERWTAADKDHPGDPIALAPRAGLRTVNTAGRINWDAHQIGIGTHHAGHELLVIARDLDISIYGQHGLIRSLTIDPTRNYQPSGQPPGRRSRTRT